VRNLAELLRLERPLAVFDLETTGVVFEMDRIIQFGVTKFYPDGAARSWKTYVDPLMTIPAEVCQKIKVSDADVAGAPTFDRIAGIVAGGLQGCDFSGFNVDFDLKFTRVECRRAGVEWDWEQTDALILDWQNVYRHLRPRTLSDFYGEFGPKGEEKLQAHDAGDDVAMTVDAAAGALDAYPELPRTVAALIDHCDNKRPSWIDKKGKIVWRNQVACLGFGNKHNGRPLADIVRDDRGYFTNFMLKGDFPADTKAIIERALRGEFPVWVPRG
jgi:DNA polymerase III subunit epsilon